MARFIYFFWASIILFVSLSAFADGFYLRGDLGIGMMDSFKATSVLGSPPAPPGQTGVSQSELDISSSFQWQAGAGYEINDYWRVDITAGQTTRADFDGTCIPSQFCPPIQVLEGDYSSTQAFLNGYYHLDRLFFGEKRAYRPYLGVGLGFAHNEISRIDAKTFQGDPISYVDSASANDFAWRVIAGMSFELTKNLLLDFSYAYMDLGDLKTDSTVNVVVPNSVFTFEILDPFTSEMIIQEVLLGLRYQF